MIEILLAIWIDTIYEFSREYVKYHIWWQSSHNYIQQYINPNRLEECYIFYIILVVYRFWLLSNFFYFIDNGFLLLSLINIVIIFVQVLWYYYIYIAKKKIDVICLILILNFTDLIYNINVISDSKCGFIFNYSVTYLLFFVLTLVVLGIWNNRWEIRKILKKPLQYQKLSHLTDPAKNSECVCCHQDYTDGDPLYYLLQCGHHAHAVCFDAWWNISKEKKCLYTFCKV